MDNDKRASDEDSEGLNGKCDLSELASAVENTQFGAEMLKLFPLDPHKAHLNHGSYGSAPKYVEMQRVKYASYLIYALKSIILVCTLGSQTDGRGEFQSGPLLQVECRQ